MNLGAYGYPNGPTTAGAYPSRYLVSGTWTQLTAQSGNSGLGSWWRDRLYLVPFRWHPEAANPTVTGIGTHVTSAGDADSLLRLGLYSLTPAGAPGMLLLDAGTVSAASTGFKSTVVSLSLPRGFYAYGVVWQQTSATVATPNTRGYAAEEPGVMVWSDAEITAPTQVSWLISSVSGALPVNASAASKSNESGPWATLKVG